MVLADRYVLRRELSVGLDTSVWHAHDPLLRRDVAIKFLSNELVGASASTDELVREATTASALGSPHLVHVFDLGRNGDGTFLVMEFVEGATLRELLTRHGRLPAPVVAAVGSQVAAALHTVHRAGVLHGDVKPENILVARPSGMVKLGDFGSAIRAEGAEFSHGGSLRYVTPERLEGGPPGPTDDLYALGLVLWECLAGRPPFLGETRIASAAMRMVHEPEPLDQVVPGVPKVLADVVTAAVRRRPQDRPAEASQVADRLGTLSGHRPWGVTADFLYRDVQHDAAPDRPLATDDEDTTLRLATTAYSQPLTSVRPSRAAAEPCSGPSVSSPTSHGSGRKRTSS